MTEGTKFSKNVRYLRLDGITVTHPWLKGCQGTMESTLRWFNMKYSVECVDLSGCQWVYNGSERIYESNSVSGGSIDSSSGGGHVSGLKRLPSLRLEHHSQRRRTCRMCEGCQAITIQQHYIRTAVALMLERRQAGCMKHSQDLGFISASRWLSRSVSRLRTSAPSPKAPPWPSRRQVKAAPPGQWGY